MKKPLFFLSAVFAFDLAFASENDFRCLRSVDQQNPVQLQFSFPGANQDAGFILYKDSPSAIPVIPRKETTLEERHPGRPSVFRTEWQEVLGNGAGGRYLIMSQGTRIYEFKYVRKDGKIFEFEMDLDAPSKNGCRWTVQ